MYGETGVVYKGIVTRASLAAQLELPKNLAIQCMIHTHQLGRHFVIALPLTEAQEKVAIAHQRSQERKYPLRFTIEDEWL
ncbi:ATP-dependent Clp protease adaptor ClpS [Parathermosynechococcus lividus]